MSTAPSFQLELFEQHPAAGEGLLLRVVGRGGPRVAALLVDAAGQRHRIEPLAGPIDNSELVRAGFPVAARLVGDAAFRLELADGTVVPLPQPSGHGEAPRAGREAATPRAQAPAPPARPAATPRAKRAPRRARPAAKPLATPEQVRAQQDEELAATRAARTRAERALAAERAKRSDIERTLEATRTQAAAELVAAASRRGELEAELEALGGELAQARDQTMALGGELATARERTAVAEAQASRSLDALRASELRVAAERDHVETMEARLAEAKAAATAAAAEVEAARARRAETAPARAADERDLALGLALSAARDHIKDLDDELGRARERVSTLDPASEGDSELARQLAAVAARTTGADRAGDGLEDGQWLDVTRAIALNMAREGRSRAEAESFLREHFDIADSSGLLDECYGPDRPSEPAPDRGGGGAGMLRRRRRS